MGHRSEHIQYIPVICEYMYWLKYPEQIILSIKSLYNGVCWLFVRRPIFQCAIEFSITENHWFLLLCAYDSTNWFFVNFGTVPTQNSSDASVNTHIAQSFSGNDIINAFRGCLVLKLAPRCV